MAFFPPLRPHFDAALRDSVSDKPASREAAAEALSSAPEDRREEAVLALRPLVDDPVSRVRAQAMASLGQLRAQSALPLILARFEDLDPGVRQIALIAAGDIGSDEAVPALKRALRSDAAEVRFQAIASLAALRPDGVAKTLGRLTDDPDAEVRAHLADALGALEDPHAADPLARLLEDEHDGVRYAAAVALARIGDARASDSLIDALSDDARFFEAAWGLGELDVQSAREPLAQTTRGLLRPLAFKAAAAAALHRLGDERGLPALRAVLKAVRWDARSYAVELVGELGAVALADEIIALSVRPRGADRVVIAKTLAQLMPEHEGARTALQALGQRRDESGGVARELLAAQGAETS
ncbi:MAG: HEAT repeat domain-containing protein [Sandaracinaceae bacterium]